MQFTKKIAAIVCLLSLVFALSCASAEVLEVKIWDNVQLPGLQAIADLWTEQSGIDVNIQVVTWDEYWTLLEAGATGGSLPDVFWMHSNSAQMYMENDMLLDLTKYIKKSDVIKMENYYQGISELYSYKGKQYAMPKEEAANIDGCSIFQRFLLIMAPLTRSAMVSLSIFTAVFAFKDLMWPMIVCSNATSTTLSAGLAKMQGQYASNFPELMAAALMACLPMIIIYLIFQKQFIEGIATSGGKL